MVIRLDLALPNSPLTVNAKIELMDESSISKISTQCPSCKRAFAVSADAINKQANCPGCNSPFTIDGFNFSGYAGVNGGTGNEAILNTSGQPITINVSNTSGATSVDTTNRTGTVTIVNNISITITVLDTNSDPVVGAVVAVYNSNTDAQILNDETDGNGDVSSRTYNNFGQVDSATDSNGNLTSTGFDGRAKVRPLARL